MQSECPGPHYARGPGYDRCGGGEKPRCGNTVVSVIPQQQPRGPMGSEIGMAGDPELTRSVVNHGPPRKREFSDSLVGEIPVVALLTGYDHGEDELLAV
jgi:hypothetical protein